MKRRLFSLLLTGAMLLSMCPPGLALEADSEDLCPHHQEHSYEVCDYVEAMEGQPCGYVCPACPVEAGNDLPMLAVEDDVNYLYCNENGQNWGIGTKHSGEYTAVTADTNAWGTADDQEHWYVVKKGETVTFDNLITVTGNVHLILADSSTLNAGKGIIIDSQSNNSLTIYAQSDNENMGTLTATGGTWKAGIQCSTGQVLTINGGSVTANGNVGAGIGGGDGGSGGIITINGGTVKATSGTGIGGGYGGSGGKITINGGSVTVNGSSSAGIGGGYGGSGGEITISGGSVTANGIGGAGIGGGDRGSGGNNIISGGTVTAASETGAGIGGGSGEDGGTIVVRGEATRVDAKSTLGAGIGGGSQARVSGAGGNITIEGGTVIATGGQSSAGIGGSGGIIGNGWDHAAGNGGTITITGSTVTATGNNAPDIGGGNGTTGIAPTDKIEISPDATVKNNSGGDAVIGPAHGTDTSKWETDDTQHWRPCSFSGCSNTDHQFKKEAHSFSDWITDEDDHWKECEICKRRMDETSHVYDQETVKPEALRSEADCEIPATYYKSCKCGTISTNDIETFTDGSALTHILTHREAVDATCTKKGNVEYWSCSACKKNFSDSSGTMEINNVTIDLVAHSWPDVWSNDGDYHWHGCTVCGEKNDLAVHIGNAEVCNAPQTCTVCGYQMTGALNHNWGGWVSNGDRTHTRTC